MSNPGRRANDSGRAANPRREVAYGLLVGVAAILVGAAFEPSNYLEHFLISSGVAVAYVGLVAGVDVVRR